MAECYALPVCGLYAESGLQPAVEVIRKTYMPDGLHPSDAGYALLADNMAAFIRSL